MTNQHAQMLIAPCCCRPPVLPQVGGADGPWRHQRRCEGLPQVRHQRHHQGGCRQDPAQERARRGRYRGVSLSCVRGNLLFIYPFKSIQDVVLWQLKIPKIIDPMKSIQSQSQNLTIFPCHILTISQSHNITISQSLTLTISQSHNLTISHSHTLTLSQSPLFQCHTLTLFMLLHYHTLTHLHSYTLTL